MSLIFNVDLSFGDKVELRTKRWDLLAEIGDGLVVTREDYGTRTIRHLMVAYEVPQVILDRERPTGPKPKVFRVWAYEADIEAAKDLVKEFRP